MALKVYNTLSRKKEQFVPVKEGEVSIYLCGPTTYENSHLGHALGPVIFDSIKRYLQHKGFKVTLVINITDVEDKIINRARELGKSVEELASEVTANYLESMEKLGVTSVDYYPKASEHIQEIITHIQRLIKLGVAYQLDGDVYFEVSKFPNYGKLSGQHLDEIEAGARVEVDERKRHPADFALWKAAKPGEPNWPSPWGKGRPGWHIECSVMSMKYLGETFDIHGGGRELIFPHHENEIAQSEAATHKPFVKYWLHNGLMQLGGEKMSKSTGVLVTISEVLERHHPQVLRFFLLSSHYRNQMDFSEERLEETGRALDGFHLLFQRIQRITAKSVYDLADDFTPPDAASLSPAEKDFLQKVHTADEAFHLAMDDDFNTAGAIAALFTLAAETNKFIDSRNLEEPDKPTEAEVVHPRNPRSKVVHPRNPRSKELLLAAGAQIRRLGKILGLLQQPIVKKPIGLEEDLKSLYQETVVRIKGRIIRPDLEAEREVSPTLPPTPLPPTSEELVQALIDVRAKARRKGDYDTADRIRSQLARLGILLEDTPTGTIWRMK